MYINIAKKHFKSNGVQYTAGQLITDPASIKRFKAKVNEGTIIALERKSKSTVPTIKFLEEKLGVEILKSVKEHLAEIDAKEQAKLEEEQAKLEEESAVDKQEESSEE